MRSEVLAWNLSGIAAKLQTEGPDYVYLKAFLQELADNGIVYELQDKQIRSLPAIRESWLDL